MTFENKELGKLLKLRELKYAAEHLGQLNYEVLQNNLIICNYSPLP
jgi:hypothetical protein